MLIRLAWHWLGRWHEPLVVGAAVALVGLAYLLPGTSDTPSTDHAHQASMAGPSPGTVSARFSPTLPTDDQFYRDQWARDAKHFYAQHPPRQSADHNAIAEVVLAAGASFDVGRDGSVAVAHAHHADNIRRDVAAGGDLQRSGSTAPAKRAAVSQRLRRWRVATCLAAGMLACLAFACLWPAAAENGHRAEADALSQSRSVGIAPAPSGPSHGEAIAIRLPAVWVRVRPTMGQTLRRGVLGGSYLTAGLGGWSMLG